MNGNKNSSVPTPLAQVMMDYLDCPCRFFPAQKDPSAVLAAWEEARSEETRLNSSHIATSRMPSSA